MGGGVQAQIAAQTYRVMSECKRRKKCLLTKSPGKARKLVIAGNSKNFDAFQFY